MDGRCGWARSIFKNIKFQVLPYKSMGKFFSGGLGWGHYTRLKEHWHVRSAAKFHDSEVNGMETMAN
jgi:hypothetical protein